MLKLVIADDEKIIRETISTIIDWQSLGIEVVSLCQNGIDAYNVIIDENPDIVLTDIRMPGMGGLELIEKVSDSNPDLQFIILSGFGEFEYAKKAMKYGVKHYLLKPCNEAQIIECIEECKQACYEKRLSKEVKEESFENTNRINHNVIFNIINDCICQGLSLEDLLKRYESYMDFEFTSYRIYYIYYLPKEKLNDFLADLKEIFTSLLPNIIMHGVYVSNSLILFFKNYSTDYATLDEFTENWNKDSLEASLDVKEETFASLHELLSMLIPKIRRYGLIYYVNSFSTTYTCNYKSHIENIDSLCQRLKDAEAGAEEELSDNLSCIQSVPFLKQLASSILLKLTVGNQDIPNSLMTEWFQDINRSEDPSEIRNLLYDDIRYVLKKHSQRNNESQMITQIHEFVDSNLSNSNLTLKYICDNCLYMNVDYVSKKFLKETGEKFSTYLTNTRINKAKEYMLNGSNERIQDIAEIVGLGNNPQYFSQLFKKVTGVTPSAFISGKSHEA